jgi:hypothetical protein
VIGDTAGIRILRASDGLGGFGLGEGGMEFVGFDVPGQADEAECGDAVPVGVELVPGEAVARGLWMGVVVVVPAFAEGEKCDPEAVAGGVRCGEAARTPHVGCRVDQPGGVQADDGAQEDAPEYAGPSSDEVEDYREDGVGHPVPAADPDVELVLAQFGNEGEKFVRVGVHGAAGDEPAHVGPEAAVVGRVRVACLVGVLVMHAVDGYPEDGAALHGEGGADGEEVLHPLGSFVSAVGEQAVVSHADAESAGDPPEREGDEEGFPGEEEQGDDGADVEGDEEEGCDPDDGLREGSVAREWLRCSHTKASLI